MKFKLYINLIQIMICSVCCSCNGSEQQKDPPLDSITQRKTFEIDHFLFLKKGMRLYDVIEYLKSIKIKYKLIEHKNWNDSVLTYKIPNECTSVLFVYNLDVADHIIDEIKIYFVENQIFSLQYYKSTSSWTDVDVSGKQMNQSEAQADILKYINDNVDIMKFLYRGLLDKYGTPTLTNNSDKDYLVENLTSLSDKDSNSSSCVNFDAYWNDLSIDQYADSIIRVRISNKLCTNKKSEFSSYLGQSYQYEQFIEVDFTNKHLIPKIDSCNKFKVTLEPGEKNIKDKRQEKLKTIL